LSNTRAVSVTIDRMKLSLRTDKGEEHVRALAEYIDEIIGELRSGLRNVNSQQIYLMASLRIAEDFFRAQQQSDDLREELRRRTDKLMRLLDNALASETS
jgi:cell division protein ZapA (FtsZ GTPase activity inhibitor)